MWLIHDVEKKKETEGVTCHDRTDSCTNDVRDADAETDTDNGAMPALDRHCEVTSFPVAVLLNDLLPCTINVYNLAFLVCV